MTTPDYITLFLYLTGLAMISVVSTRRTTSQSEMFAAGRSSPWWASGLSGFMTMFSANTFVVWGGIAYELGIVAVLINTCYGIAALGVGYFVAGYWNKLGVATPAEFVRLRFGRGGLHFFTWTILLKRILGVGEAALREALGGLRRPLRPLWLSQESRLCLADEDADGGRDESAVREDALKAFTPLYLVSASRVADPHEARVPEGSRWTWDYVQGAGDDAEYWAEGLTPEDYWKNREFLLGPGPSDLSSRIAEVVASRVRGGAPGRTSAGTHRFAAEGCGDAVPELVTGDENGVYWIRGTGLGLGDCNASATLGDDVAVVNCSLQVLSSTCVEKGRIIHLPVQNFKERRGPQLSTALPAALAACRKWLGEGLRVLVVCDDGRDTSVCVAVTLLLSLFSPSTSGELRLDDAFLREPLRTADKSRVRQVLAYVSAAYPPAQASRGMLKQVYEFFREPRGPWNPPVSA